MLDSLKKEFPRAKNPILTPIVALIQKDPKLSLQHSGLYTLRRKACFLGQIAHETDGFHTLEEYASGAAYEGRKDLGNVQPGDGIKFKGRGYIQLTGRANYESMARQLHIPLEDFVRRMQTDPLLALQVSMRWWGDRKINDLADILSYERITRRINGGLNGLKDRTKRTEFFLNLLENLQK